jgi:hypothetical protein
MKSCLLILAALCGWLSMESPAAACKCLPPDPYRSYENADHVLHVRVQGLLSQSASRRSYAAVLVDDDYKGCLTARTRVVIETATSSASCGMSLRAGEYLLHGHLVGAQRGIPRLSVGTCDLNVRWKELTDEQRAYLDSRFVCCGDECSCADGSEPVNCFVDPCRVSSCDVPGAECRSNYCGGCNAEWVDESGASVCEQDAACDYDDTARRYVARSPTACMAVRFACAAGESAFFDDCGCGCEPAVQTACQRAGCSGQLCVEPGDGRVTTCEFRPEYACYQAATCERQPEGTCGFTDTPELAECLQNGRWGADELRSCERDARANEHRIGRCVDERLVLEAMPFS